MIQKRQVFICDSHRPRIHGGGCCSDRGGARLAGELEKMIVERQLSGKIEVKVSGCMRNCRAGISMKIMPDNVLYGKLKVSDFARIIDEHLVNNKIVKSLLVKEVPRFFPI